MTGYPRTFATIFLAVMLLATTEGGAQDGCCRIQTDYCCNRSMTVLPCYVCDPGWPATECCWFDIGEFKTQTVMCDFKTGWAGGTFWHFTRFDGCMWGERTCDIDEGCVWDLQ